MGNDKVFDILRVIDLKTVVDRALLRELLATPMFEINDLCEQLIEEAILFSSPKGLLVTPKGKEWLKNEYQTRFGKVRNESGVLEAYQEFETLNEEFLSSMTKWQMLDIGGQSVPNEHDDAEYDSMVISELAGIVDNLNDLLATMPEAVSHLGLYSKRFDDALNKIQAGEIALVSDPRQDSLHNIWFEFHEDFLRVIGRGRR